MATVCTKSYSGGEIDRREVLRYAGAGLGADEVERLLDGVVAEALGELSYKLCYTVLPIKFGEREVDLGFAKTRSESLIKRLSGCESIILFAATVGVGIDRLIRKSALTSPARALLLDSLGTERVEWLCDTFFREISTVLTASALGARPRFSPGYGDLPITLQRDVFKTLECEKHIGLTLNESCLMSPQKSVSAIIGLYKL